MLFSSTIFLLLFLPSVLLLNILARKRLSNLVLLISSLIFYGFGEPTFVFLMILSIIINWIAGLQLDQQAGRKKDLILLSGVTLNLAILGYYKYALFFSNVVRDIIGFDLLKVEEHHLPIGISFFTFQAISYLLDVYKKQCRASRSLVHVALYISFFPQLIAGPIVKYRDISKQIEERSISWTNISDGFKRFIYGLAKKVLIANTLAEYVDMIFAHNVTELCFCSAWIGALSYGFQIYYDFSGYSDMAIGLGKIFGFNIPENFNYPFASRSISEFWRRWHISLCSWFKEYVYIPLGGSRCSTVRTCLNLVLVFFLTGIWHGANYTYIVWGLFHGFFIIVERLGLNKILSKLKFLSHAYFFTILTISWPLFRSDNISMAFAFVKKMLIPFDVLNNEDFIQNRALLILGIIAILGSGILKYHIPLKIQRLWSGSLLEGIYCLILLILSLASIIAGNYNPFIYFQF